MIFKPLDQITAEDVHELCRDQAAETAQLELKSDLPTRDRSRRDNWYDRHRSVGEYARNAVAEEVTAFANSFGGTVLIGIRETDDKPNRAEAIQPIPQVHNLARRLRQAIQDIIDPPIPLLEAEGIVTEEDGHSGVVLIRVAPSRRRPHRLNSNKEVYIRRMDESVRVDMRQIQELTIQSFTSATGIEELLAERRSEFADQFAEWIRGAAPDQRARGTAFHFVGVPTTPIDLGRITGRSDIVPSFADIIVRIEGEPDHQRWPFEPSSRWRPGLRSICSTYEDNTVKCQYVLRTNGCCELSYFRIHTFDPDGLFVGWIAAAAAGMLFWIERIRRAAGSPSLEFALAPTIMSTDDNAVLASYGARRFQEALRTRGTFPVGSFRLPVLSIGGEEEFESILDIIDEDIWNLCGVDVHRYRPSFDLAQARVLLSGTIG